MNVRVRTGSLAAELSAYLRERGFFVVERGHGELEVRLLNPVSDRYDRRKELAALREWAGEHPGALLGGAPER